MHNDSILGRSRQDDDTKWLKLAEQSVAEQTGIKIGGNSKISDVDDAPVPPDAGLPKVERFQVRGPQFYFEKRQPKEFMVDGLFGPRDLIMYVGNPGTKKTYSLMYLAACIATGTEWCGFSTKKARVLIVDEESGERRTADRLAGILSRFPNPSNVEVHSISLANFNFFAGKKDAELLEEIVRSGYYGLVIIDAMADIMLGGDENSAKDVSIVMSNLRGITDRANCATIVIHHTNKTGGYRGSSVFPGSIDLMVMVESDKGSSTMSFKTEKERDIEFKQWAATTHFEDGSFWMDSADGVKLPQTDTKKNTKNKVVEDNILLHLNLHGACTRQDLIDADIVDKGQARGILNSMVMSGKIIYLGSRAGGRNKPVRYQLANRPIVDETFS